MSVDLTETADAAFRLLRDALRDLETGDRVNCCAYCGIQMRVRRTEGKPIPPQQATRDHVIPKSQNGRGVTIPACRECNQAKGNTSLPEFLLSAYFTEKRKRKQKHKWPVERLWMAAALAAMKQARDG